MIESISNARRRLQKGGGRILVAFKIETSSEAEGFGVQNTLQSTTFVSKLTTELEALKVIEDSETQSFSFDTDSVVRKDNKAAARVKRHTGAQRPTPN